MKKSKRLIVMILMLIITFGMLTGCSLSSVNSEKVIVRVGHNQSQNHPIHVSLLAFEEYVEAELGNKYDVQIYPSELLGSQTNMVQLTQTGAINFSVASNSILETFDDVFEIFNLPYLFASPDAYHAVMDDEELTEPIYTSTADAGFEVVTWFDAGTRNFYTLKTPINSPSDLKGLKIRVQQSPTNVRMMELLGGSASPMGFGEVYTSLQAGIIDGAENNEMALTDNGHGEVSKFYSYDMHQMVPDMLIGNYDFLQGLSVEDRVVFEEGFKIANSVERKEWTNAVEKAKNKAEKDMGVTFLYPDQEPFKEICLPLHDEVLTRNPKLQGYYDKIQEYNEQYPGQTSTEEDVR
jgi:tripartite ATP-independent transporter DctP family solute receptor